MTLAGTRRELISLLRQRALSRLSVFDHGPGKCDVEGCPHERYRWASTGHFSSACALHAWARIHEALDEADEIPEVTAAQWARARPAWEFFAARAFIRWVARLSGGQNTGGAPTQKGRDGG